MKQLKNYEIEVIRTKEFYNLPVETQQYIIKQVRDKCEIKLIKTEVER